MPALIAARRFITTHRAGHPTSRLGAKSDAASQRPPTTLEKCLVVLVLVGGLTVLYPVPVRRRFLSPGCC